MTTSEDFADYFFQLATAFRLSAPLFAALELEVFTNIPDEGATSTEVAQKLGVEELPLRLLLNALVGMGLLAKARGGDGRFYVPPGYAPLLRKGPGYIGNDLFMHKEQNEHWLKLADLIRGQSAGTPYYEGLVKSPRMQNYLSSIEDTNRPYADEMMDKLSGTIGRARRVLDIGGGHGYYAARILELNKNATVTVLDLERSIEHGRARQQNNPSYDRFNFVVGNALTQAYENEFDLVMLNDLLHYFSMEEKLEVIHRAVRALKDGGTIAISDFHLDESGAEPSDATLFSLRMYINTRKGFLATDEQTVALLKDAGARDVEVAPLGDRKTLFTGLRQDAQWTLPPGAGTEGVALAMSDNLRSGTVGTNRQWETTAVDAILSSWAKNFTESFEGLEPPDPPGMIVFGAGYPDVTLLPLDALIAAAQRAMEAERSRALRYDDTSGDLLVRAWLADRLNAQESAGVGQENFFLTNGSNQAIYLASAVFLDPGDVALVERPTYQGAISMLRGCGAELVGVNMDDEGLDVTAFADTVRSLAELGRSPKLFYTMASMHNPTGLTTPVSRREAVVEICDRHRILIVEDDAYGEIRMEGKRPPSYYTLTGGQGALRISTVSKMLANALRVGWVTAREDVIEALRRLPLESSMSAFVTRMVAEFFLSGDEESHLKRVIPLYREKRDCMLAALDEHCAQHATWTRPEGGFFLWMRLRESIEPDRLAEAMAAECVAARTGHQFFLDLEPNNYLRLSFSELSVEEIEEGIRRLGRALDRSVRP
jgi:2-aminoadipate transaminase